MAVITRRTFEQIRDEVLKREGQKTPSADLQTRTEHLIDGAYRHLALTFHHFELEKLDQAPLVLSTSTNVLALPADCFAVIAVTLRTPGTRAYKGPCNYRDIRELQARFRDESGVPTEYARGGDLLEFNKIADLAYEIDLRYYREPTAPDFANGGPSSELGREWDEYLIQTSLAWGWPTRWRFDLAQMQAAGIGQLLSEVVNPALSRAPVSDIAERSLSGSSLGGAR